MARRHRPRSGRRRPPDGPWPARRRLARWAVRHPELTLPVRGQACPERTRRDQSRWTLAPRARACCAGAAPAALSRSQAMRPGDRGQPSAPAGSVAQIRALARCPRTYAAPPRARAPSNPLRAAPGALIELLRAAASLVRRDRGVLAGHLRAPALGLFGSSAAGTAADPLPLLCVVTLGTCGCTLVAYRVGLLRTSQGPCRRSRPSRTLQSATFRRTERDYWLRFAVTLLLPYAETVPDGGRQGDSGPRLVRAPIV